MTSPLSLTFDPMDNKDEETMDEIFETVNAQFKKISSKIKPSDETPMFFSYEPKYEGGKLTFLFDSTKAIKLQIRDFLLQTDVDESHIKNLKCHFEYYHCTQQWVVMNLNTSIENFGIYNQYHMIRLRYHK